MYLGLDIGSSSSKVVLLGEGGEILAAQVKEEETKTQEQAPSEDGSLPVSSLFDEEEYLERAFKDKGGYQIVQRTTKLTEEGVVEHLTVTEGDGSKHQFQFKITP